MSEASINPNDHNTVTELEMEGKTVVQLSINEVVVMIYGLEEEHLVKPEALAVLEKLRNMKMHIHMITGDNKHSAFKIADHCKIS
jgi:P-type E1-E2 ATPase